MSRIIKAVIAGTDMQSSLLCFKRRGKGPEKPQDGFSGGRGWQSCHVLKIRHYISY